MERVHERTAKRAHEHVGRQNERARVDERVHERTNDIDARHCRRWYEFQNDNSKF